MKRLHNYFEFKDGIHFASWWSDTYKSRYLPNVLNFNTIKAQ